MCQVVAKVAGKNVEMVIDNEETRATKEYKTFNPTNKFPLLVTPEGNISESIAVAKYLAHGHATLLGGNGVQRAQVDQWMNWGIGSIAKFYPAVMAVTGRSTEVTSAQFNECVKQLKEKLRGLDQALSGDWLVGNSCTAADICLGALFAMPFQLILDQGFSKAAPKACAWFARVCAVPEFISIFGKVKMAKKGIKPVLKSEEKAPKKQAQAAPKPKKDDGEAGADDKPAKNPLDALPPTSFDLFNFKTYFVNVPDKRGEGHTRFMNEVDREGYTWWWLHYEKFGEEGKVEYKFQNLLEGFMQRLDNFRKHAFGKICMLGEVPNLEMQGVLLVRGKVLPQELIDHPQFEYTNPRKMDWNSADDMNKVKDFMAATEGQQCNGMKAAMVCWHK